MISRTVAERQWVARPPMDCGGPGAPWPVEADLWPLQMGIRPGGVQRDIALLLLTPLDGHLAAERILCGLTRSAFPPFAMIRMPATQERPRCNCTSTSALALALSSLVLAWNPGMRYLPVRTALLKRTIRLPASWLPPVSNSKYGDLSRQHALYAFSACAEVLSAVGRSLRWLRAGLLSCPPTASQLFCSTRHCMSRSMIDLGNNRWSRSCSSRLDTSGASSLFWVPAAKESLSGILFRWIPDGQPSAGHCCFLRCRRRYGGRTARRNPALHLGPGPLSRYRAPTPRRMRCFPPGFFTLGCCVAASCRRQVSLMSSWSGSVSGSRPAARRASAH